MSGERETILARFELPTLICGHFGDLLKTHACVDVDMVFHDLRLVKKGFAGPILTNAPKSLTSETAPSLTS